MCVCVCVCMRVCVRVCVCVCVCAVSQGVAQVRLPTAWRQPRARGDCADGRNLVIAPIAFFTLSQWKAPNLVGLNSSP